MVNNSFLHSSSQRIDYIDALKGFLILSVVMCHVSGFCIGIQDDIPSYLPILFEFRNPPFFFISGFFAYKIGTTWNWRNTLNLIKKKFFTIAWPTFIFLAAIIYIHPCHNGRSFLHNDVRDLWFHWFTLSLFVFFVFYSIIEFCLSVLKNEEIKSIILLVLGALSYLFYSVQSVYDTLPITDHIKDLLGMPYWGFFFFFVLGILSRKYYSKFITLLDNKYFVAICIILFFLFNLFSQFLQKNYFNLFRITTYLTGIILVVSFFRTYPIKGTFKTILTFVGKRTLQMVVKRFLPTTSESI